MKTQTLKHQSKVSQGELLGGQHLENRSSLHECDQITLLIYIYMRGTTDELTGWEPIGTATQNSQSRKDISAKEEIASPLKIILSWSFKDGNATKTCFSKSESPEICFKPLFLKNVTVWNKSPFDVFFIISMIYLYIGLFREGLKGFDLSCWQENELINYSPLNWKSYVSYPASNRISPLLQLLKSCMHTPNKLLFWNIITDQGDFS